MEDETETAGVPSSLEGAVLGERYEVTSQLGEGGMATVYLATDLRFDRPVVLKIPRLQLMLHEEFKARFALEVGSLAKHEHPHILRIQDVGEHEGVPYAVLDYLPGGDLGERIVEAGGSLPTNEIAPWLVPIARGLDFIHARGILHRDVKPANVLFDAHGAAFLSDFGIVTAIESIGWDTTQTDPALTVAGQFIGSPSFAPPEALERDFRPTYDQYSLGVTVYFALSGQYPVARRRPLAARALEEPIPLTDRVPSLDPAVAAVVMRAIARDPDDRFGSCHEFAEAFVAAERASTPRPARETGARRPLLGAAGLVLLVALLAAYWAFAPARPAEDTRTSRADREAQRSKAAVPSPVLPTVEAPRVPVLPPAATPESEPSPSPEPTASPSPVPTAPPATPAPAPTAPPVATAVSALPPVPGMASFSGGAFVSGCDLSSDPECDPDSAPVRRRLVGDFWLDRHEVTVEDYQRCVDAGACTEPDDDTDCNWGQAARGRHPVNCVDWDQANAYCAFEGKRLPTEWEWERAARGHDGRTYTWGNRGFVRAGRVANIADAFHVQSQDGWALGSEGYEDGFVATAPVGSFPDGATPEGVQDLIGNVWEWTSSRVQGDPDLRVIRGGSWDDPPMVARGATRLWSGPQQQRSSGGFRCAKSP